MVVGYGRKESGFSLIEIVVAIVIMSVISIGLVDFITNSAGGYVQTATRNQVSAGGRVAIDRIAMELRNALPGSVRIFPNPDPRTITDADGYAGDQCLEFIPVRAATTYLNPAFRPAAHKLSFEVVDFVPGQEGETGLYASIYPTSSAQLYGADLNGTGMPPKATTAIARVDVTNHPTVANKAVLTYSRLDDDAPYEHRFLRESSVDRLFLTEEPVSYCITGSKLFRYHHYGFSLTQMLPERPNGGGCAAAPCLPASTADGRALISDQVDNSTLIGGAAGQAFDQQEPSRRRNGVVQLDINFSQDGEQVRLNHEVLLQNTP